jgi:MFS family permease
LIFGAGWGIIRALQTPIYQALPRKLAKDLSKGTALLTAVTYAARGLGPILGGLLYDKAGQSAAFLANFISFLPSLLLLCFIRIPKAEPCTKIRIKEWIPPLLRIFLVCFLGVNYNVTFVALARQGGLGSDSYGFALGLLGLGALIGFFLRAARKKQVPFPLLVGGMGGLNLGLALGSGLWWQGGCILLYGILDFLFFAQSLYRLSGAARAGEQTAVMGLYTVATVGALPAGALFWSFAAQAAGVKIALWGIGGGLMIFALSELLQRMETNEKSIGNI